MMKVILHGSYFGNNFGDTLLMALIKEAIERSGRHRVIMPFASSETLEVLRAKRGISEVINGEYAGIVLGGGGYFGQPPGGGQIWSWKFLLRHTPLPLLSIRRQKNIGAWGIGAGPLSNSLVRYFAKRICDSAGEVVVRDDESALFLKEDIGTAAIVEVTTDLAMSLSPRPVEREPHSMPIVVHIGPSASNVPQATKLRSDVVRLVAETGRTVIIVVDNCRSKGQCEEALRLQEALKGTETETYYHRDPQQTLDVIARAGTIITTKLHVGIVATAIGRHVISFPTHPKTLRFYRQAGLHDRCVPLLEYDSGVLLDIYRATLESALPPNVDQMRQSALQTIAVMRATVDSWSGA